MNKTILCLILIALIPLISGTCQEGQVDINTASAEELKKIHQVSDTRAKEIINLRNEKLFESLDDLGRVNGIKLDGSRLKDIKNRKHSMCQQTRETKAGGGVLKLLLTILKIILKLLKIIKPQAKHQTKLRKPKPKPEIKLKSKKPKQST